MKNTNLFYSLLFSCIVLFTSSCYNDNKDDLYDIIIVPGNAVPCEFTDVSYQTDIVPLVNLKCNSCHNQTDRLGNIILETYSQVKQYIDDGSFVGSIKYDPAYEVMPPLAKLPQCDIDKIEFWVSNGAPNN